MEVYVINTEIWKDIEGYEDLYQVSNYGAIKSLDRFILRNDGVTQFKKGQVITPTANSDGYYQLKLCKNGKSHTYKVHQIVAKHFLTKPNDYEMRNYEVNHKDYDRKNNNVNNLEWLVHIDNVKYSANNGRYKKDIFGSNNPNYGNHKLSDYYKNNPDIALEKLSRPAEQNGRATKIELYDEKMNYIDTFGWIGACAEYLKNNGYTNANINSIRGNINIACKNNKKYLKHYYNKIA